MNVRIFSFVGGETGLWRVVNISTVVGDPLAHVERLNIVAGGVAAVPDGAKWLLRGITSNERYVTRAEKEQLVAEGVVVGARPGRASKDIRGKLEARGNGSTLSTSSGPKSPSLS